MWFWKVYLECEKVVFNKFLIFFDVVEKYVWLMNKFLSLEFFFGKGKKEIEG